jgi:hypothetical protein
MSYYSSELLLNKGFFFYSAFFIIGETVGFFLNKISSLNVDLDINKSAYIFYYFFYGIGVIGVIILFLFLEAANKEFYSYY